MVSASENGNLNGGLPPESGGDLEELARVIRRHAEELARLSGRMTGGAGGEKAAVLKPNEEAESPPHRTASPVRRRDVGGMPSLADDLALSAESLPVLNAFRQFIEAERRRARARLAWVGAVFTILLALILAGAWVGLRRYQVAMRGEINSVRGETAQRIEQTEAILRQVTEATEGMNQKLDGALSSTRAAIESQLSERDSELRELREALVTLQIEQAFLQGAVKPAESGEPLEEVQRLESALAKPSEKEEAPRELPLLVRPGGTGRPIPFRLPLSP